MCLALQNNARPEFHLAGLTVTEEPFSPGTSRFDLFISVTEQDEDGAPARIGGFAEYATELFDAGTVSTLLDRSLHFLRQVVAAPETPIGSVGVLAEHERAALSGWGGGGRDARFDAGTLPERFAATAAATPDATALVSADGTLAWTYAELDRWGQPPRPPLPCPRRPPGQPRRARRWNARRCWSPPSGVLKTGAAYVPVDPTYPPERIDYLLADLAPAVTVYEDLAEEDLDGLPDSPPETEGVGESAVAYAMYTSGSTGRPKGVEVTHRNVVDLALDGCFGTGAHHRVLLHSPHTFDASTYEMWVPLLGGGTAVAACWPARTPRNSPG